MRSRSVAPLVVLGIGVLLTAVVFGLLRRSETDRERLTFQRDAEAMTASVKAQAAGTLDRLADLGAFLASSSVPSREQFTRYLQSAGLRRQSWLKAVVFAERVPRAGVRDLVRRERAIDPRFRVTARRRGADHFVVLTRASGLRRPGQVLGRDLSSTGLGPFVSPNAARRPPTLGQVPRAGLLLSRILGLGTALQHRIAPGDVGGISPVFDPAGALRGWLVFHVDPEAMFSDVRPRPGRHVAVDILRPEGDTPFAVLGAAAPGDGPTVTRGFRVAGLRWEVAVTREAPVRPQVATSVLLGGGLVASLVAALLTAFVGRARRAEDSLHETRREAGIDPLTGLLNRRGLEAAIDELPGDLAVLFCDVDRFKVVNDSLGHEAGDLLLRAVAERLRSSVRSGDVVGRFGGDEFIVACTGIDRHEAATGIARSLEQALATPVTLAGGEFVVSASIGIALRADSHRSAEDLIREADTAMYAAKRAGGGFRLFDAELGNKAVERLTIERALRSAVAEGSLRVAYQPIVRAADGGLVGVEALLRWDHPLLGEVSPGRFLPVAQEIGLMGQIGRMVLRTACEQAAAWNALAPDLAPLQVAVNVSDAQLADTDFVAAVAGAVAGAGIEATQLTLEVTEDLLLERVDAHLATLGRLAGLGVKLSVDDFGTGRSSLAHLQRLTAISEIKIDRSFVARLHETPVNEVMIRAVGEIASGIGAELVAEGVETEAQLETLRRLGIHRAQGHWFGAAQPPQALDGAVRDRGAGVRPA